MRGMSFFGPPVSKSKLTRMMVEVLLKLPEGTPYLKDNVVMNLGLVGQTCTTRYINDAWNRAKKTAARDYSERFILDNKNALRWNNGSVEVLDKDITTSNYKKLNELARSENLTVNELISKLIRNYKKCEP